MFMKKSLGIEEEQEIWWWLLNRCSYPPELMKLYERYGEKKHLEAESNQPNLVLCDLPSGGSGRKGRC